MTDGSEPAIDGEPAIVVLPDAEAASEAAATRIATALVDAVSRRGRADWVTTGGSTPTSIYRHLARPPLRDEIPWDRIHVWWTDDRFVARDDPLSNRLPLDTELTGAGVPLPASNVHGMPIDEALARGEPPEIVATAYEAELRSAPLDVDELGAPVFDVILAGVGPDGHVLSVFPGSPLFEAAAWVSAVAAPTHVEPHVARISLSPRVLTAARLPIVVALGSAKAAIVDELFGPERDVRRWPAQLARRPSGVWFLDAAAAARLPLRWRPAFGGSPT